MTTPRESIGDSSSVPLLLTPRMIFTATSVSSVAWRARYTTPKLPLPITSISS